MKDKFEPIPDPTPEQGFEGLYAGTIESGSEYEPGEYFYDLRGLTKYLREHNLDQPTEEILKMFEM